MLARVHMVLALHVIPVKCAILAMWRAIRARIVILLRQLVALVRYVILVNFAIPPAIYAILAKVLAIPARTVIHRLTKF
jgi:hypothetical protein